MHRLFIIIILIISTSCSQKVVEIPVKGKEVIVEKFTPIQVPADSSIIEALFECDSLQEVRLKEIHELKTKKIQSSIDFKNQQFKYKIITKHDTIFLPSKTTTITKEIPIEVEVERIIYKQRWWQRSLMIIGIAAIVLTLTILIIKLK